MRQLRDQRAAALAAHDAVKLKSVRRQLHRLNRQIRLSYGLKRGNEFVVPSSFVRLCRSSISADFCQHLCRMKITRFACSAAFAIAVAALGTHLSGQTATVACAVAPLQQKAPKGTTITGGEGGRGQRQPAALLPGRRSYSHSRQRGQLPGSGLPERWNGKYYFVGVGGLGGTIGRLDAGLARGYASASTDTGHDANDPTWGSNHAKEIDYGHRGTHVTAVAGKAADRLVLRPRAASMPTSKAARTADARR